MANNENVGNTPFDDVYRTLTVKATRLMIPLINYMFNQDYSMSTPIRLANNETPKNKGESTITDSRFVLANNEEYNIFIIEEQTNLDKNIEYRLYDYMLRHASDYLSKDFERGRIVLPSVGVLNLRGDNKNIKPMKVVHTNGEIDVTMKDISMQNVSNLEYLEEKNLYCLMPFYSFTIEDKLRKYENEAAKQLYKQELDKYYSIIQKAEQKGVLIEDEASTLSDIRRLVIDGLRFHKSGLNVKELEDMGGKVIELEHEKRYKAGYNEGTRETANQKNKIIFNLLMKDTMERISALGKAYEDNEDLVNMYAESAFEKCKDAIPEWDDARLKSEFENLRDSIKKGKSPYVAVSTQNSITPKETAYVPS